MQPTAGDNFLLAFDYRPPVSELVARNILYIHSTRPDKSQKALSRLLQLYPEAKFLLLKGEDASFPENDRDRVEALTFQGKFLPPDLSRTPLGKRLTPDNIDAVYFCVNIAIGAEFDLVGFKEQYSNLLQSVTNLGLIERTYAIDKNFRVFPLSNLDIDGWTRNWTVKGKTFYLPWTLLSLREKEELFELARSGPGEGAIVNIGHFLGGSSIILAGGSKERGRERVHSLDVKKYDNAEDLYKKNGVEDWIAFQQMESGKAASQWAKRPDTAIRLLIVDGDHSYEGCKKDLLDWSPYLVSGGTLAVHDYCNVSEGVDFSSIVEAVYDVVLDHDDFHRLRRVETLLIAEKK
ncbi:MAG: class I SAM-dependent methyltransferase [Nitrospinae bacterium]|nr:class I SAM-dependent methyltransferase [Nitrospinota bacterium]